MVSMTFVLLLVLPLQGAQTVADAVRLYDAGKYREAADLAAAGDSQGQPRLLYLIAQSR